MTPTPQDGGKVNRKCRACRYRGPTERCPKCGAICDAPLVTGPPSPGVVAVIGFARALGADALLAEREKEKRDE